MGTQYPGVYWSKARPIKFNSHNEYANWFSPKWWKDDNVFTTNQLFGPLVPGPAHYAPVARVELDKAGSITIGNTSLSISLEPGTDKIYVASEDSAAVSIGDVKYKRFFPYKASTFHMKSFKVTQAKDVTTACTTYCGQDMPASSCLSGCLRNAYDAACEQFGLYVETSRVEQRPSGCMSLGQKVDLDGAEKPLEERLDFRSVAKPKVGYVAPEEVTLTASDLSIEAIDNEAQKTTTDWAKEKITQVTKLAAPLLQMTSRVGLDEFLLGKAGKEMGSTLGETVDVVTGFLDAFGWSDTSEENAKKIKELTEAVNRRFEKVSDTMKGLNARITQVETKLRYEIQTNGDAIEQTNFNLVLQLTEQKRKQLNNLITLATENGFLSKNFPKRTDIARYIQAYADVTRTVDAKDLEALGLCGEVMYARLDSSEAH